MVPEKNPFEMDLSNSPLYEDELNEIQGLMNDLSSELLNNIKSNDKCVKKSCNVFTSRDTYILTCTQEEFKARLANMNTDDLEKSKRVFENEFRYIDTLLKADSLSVDEVSELKNKKELIWARLLTCIEQREVLKDQLSNEDFLSMLLTTSPVSEQDDLKINSNEPFGDAISDKKQPSPNPTCNITRERLLCCELEEMSAEQLMGVLKHSNIPFDAKDSKEDLIVLIKKKLTQNSTENIIGIEAHKMMTEWNPIILLEDICSKYTLETKTKKESLLSKKKKMLSMQGYLEKLPVNQSKAKRFKGWKKRFFKFSSGVLYYYENHNTNVHLGSIELKEAEIKMEAGKIITINSQVNGKSLSMRCSTQAEANDWFKVIQFSQCMDEEEKEKDIVILDLGSSVIRVGQEDSPEICIPTAVALKNFKGKYDQFSGNVLGPENCSIGLEALLPNNRANSKLIYPLKPDLTVDQYAIKVRFIPLLLDKAFQQLQINPRNKTIIISYPKYITDSDKEYISDFLFSQLNVAAVCMQEQALLSLYSYSATTGIIVDIGDHLDVLPIVEGSIINKGVTSLPSLGQLITGSLGKLLSGEGYRFFSDIENYVVQYIKEQVAEVLSKPKDQLSKQLVDISRFNLPYNFKTLEVGDSRFECVEGLFQPSMWGKDFPSLQACVEKAVKACEIDHRREISKNIYLSGGSSLIKGLAERLEKELQSVVPSGVQVKVSANVHRINAAYKGAFILSSLPNFQQLCVTKNEWISEDIPTLMRRW